MNTSSITAIRVHLRLLTPDEGGRATPFECGYKPHFSGGGYEGSCCVLGRDEPGDCQLFEPGHEYPAVLLLPREPPEGLRVGTKFELNEVYRSVATGEVLAIEELSLP